VAGAYPLPQHVSLISTRIYFTSRVKMEGAALRAIVFERAEQTAVHIYGKRMGRSYDNCNGRGKCSGDSKSEMRGFVASLRMTRWQSESRLYLTSYEV
jgi:hypothetical protein